MIGSEDSNDLLCVQSWVCEDRNSNDYNKILKNQTTCSLPDSFWGTYTEFSKYIDADQGYKLYSMKPQYQGMIASMSEKYLYFDFLDGTQVPKVYRTEYVSGTAIPTVIRKNASRPVVSVDDSILTYRTAENASYEDNVTWHTVIEKNGQIAKQFDDDRLVMMDETDREIYTINLTTRALEIYSMDDLSLKASGSVDEGMVFPQLVDGKLRYFCPQAGSDIYAVKTEA
jgi:hypothetical protein